MRVALLRHDSIQQAALLAGLLAGCAGPNLHLDTRPAPDWIARGSSAQQPLQAVGQAPATVEPQRDRQIATRNAKERIAQRFVSKVRSRASDWMVQASAGDQAQTQQVSTRSIQVESQVTLEHVAVQEAFRDPESRTQYVLVEVDGGAWTRSVRKRVKDGLADTQKALEAATGAVQAEAPFSAFAALQRARRGGQGLEGDVRVLGLLDPDAGASARLARQHERLEALQRQLQRQLPVSIHVQGGDTDRHADVRRELEAFLGKQGLSTTQQPDAAAGRINIALEQRFETRQDVAGRTEFLHAAAGEVVVTQGEGERVDGLSVALGGNAYVARGATRSQGSKRALELAAETLTAKFRSRFRRWVGEPR